MNREVASTLALLGGWLAACLLAPYSLWRLIISPLTEVTLTEYVVLHLVIGVVLLAGSLFSAAMLAGLVEAGMLVFLGPVSILAMLLGLGLMAITRNLNAPSTFVPESFLTIITGSVMIASLAPFVISIALAIFSIVLLSQILLDGLRAN